MEENISRQDFLPPINTNTFGIPNKIDIMAAYNVYKPSMQTRKLKSEAGRSIFAEEFIEDPKLGTLSDLSVRALALGFGTKDIAPLVSSDPLKLRIHYDSLDVEMPLDKCYFVDDVLFWRRVVLAKHRNKALALKKLNYPWKNLGVSLKYVDLVESCQAEYWPEEEMRALALKVREFVTEMHISKLQTLKDSSFEEYLVSDSSLGSDTSSESSEFVTPTASIVPSVQFDENGDPLPEREKTAAELEEEAYEAEERAAHIKQLREEKAARRLKKEERRKRREAMRAPPPPSEPKVKKKKTKKIKSVFEIEVSPDEDDGEANKNDRRNLEKYLNRLKKYTYPPEHCHHIDLRFVGDFIYMTSFTIEFQGPEMQRDYHTKHFNFSYVDTQHLSDGLQHLHLLKTFRLINSRVDAKKLVILLKTLQTLNELEELDFSNDQLQDDCGHPIYHFFKRSSSLKRLDLARNNINTNVLTKIAKGLDAFEGSLEYLSLGGNRLGDEGLHTLTRTLINRQQVKSLSLRGAHISQEAIICCISNELLREHEVLLELDIVAIPVGLTAAKELVTALNLNKRILKLDCQACELDIDIEFDIKLLLERNHYILENPYIGDETKTKEEIMAFVERVKHPILLKAFQEFKESQECLINRVPDFKRSSEMLVAEKKEEELPAQESDIWAMHKPDDEKPASKEPSIKSDHGPGPVEEEPFIFEPRQFTYEEFWTHVYVPGPSQRFFYFQAKNERGATHDYSK